VEPDWRGDPETQEARRALPMGYGMENDVIHSTPHFSFEPKPAFYYNSADCHV
jgi:hypothetical protein